MKLRPSAFEQARQTAHNQISLGVQEVQQDRQNPLIRVFDPLPPVQIIENAPQVLPRFFLRPSAFETTSERNSQLDALNTRIRPINSQVSEQSLSSLADTNFFTGKKNSQTIFL